MRASMRPARNCDSTMMPIESATRPVTLRTTIRRARLDELWVTKNCQLRAIQAPMPAPSCAVATPRPALWLSSWVSTVSVDVSVSAVRSSTSSAGVWIGLPPASHAARWGEDRRGGRTPLLPHVSRPVRSPIYAYLRRWRHRFWPLLPSTRALRGAPIVNRVSPLRNAGRRSRIMRPHLFLKAISDTIQRFDHIELAVAGFELFAQPFDVTVDGAVIDVNLIVIGRIHQGVAAFHHAGAARQGLQDQKFGYRERHRLVFPGAGVALWIHAQQAALEHLAVRLLGNAAVLGRGTA